MIKEVTMYTVICDNCKIDVNEGQDISCWNDTDYSETAAYEGDWKKIGDKHYCTDCFYYDDNDKLIIIESRINSHLTTQSIPNN